MYHFRLSLYHSTADLCFLHRLSRKGLSIPHTREKHGLKSEYDISFLPFS